ncbi:hypothetical protein AS159_08795 [Thermotoga sp. Ku-13t]|uniref:hypothetical protein n=1 Tax=Thermotoga sp. Ku-13t TaxID=1755813 RepID=UPI0016998A12|nr:hypothetical protein [Thermotoga sp. Ku-13t]KAF2957130.1 hypothetical protein AS159_08795 [Thermotoga sp. Ku-13t]
MIDRIIDAFDVETTLLAKSEEEAKNIAVQYFKSLGFNDVDVVFVEHSNFAARIRLRVYVFRPGDKYAWLAGGDTE